MALLGMTKTEPKHPLELHWKAFEEFLQAQEIAAQPAWITALRRSSMAEFAELGFPTTADEDWRFTNLSGLSALPFRPVIKTSSAANEPAELSGELTFQGILAHRLVFVDGIFSKPLSKVGSLPKGAIVTNLASAIANHPELLEKHLGRYSRGNRNAFAALNTAFFTDGAFISVPSGVNLETPVHLVFLNTAPGNANTKNLRNLLIAGNGSQSTIIESHHAVTDEPYFVNVATELVAGDNAVMEHVKFQDEGPGAYHIASINTQMDRSVNLASHSFALGGRLSRNNIRACLAGQGIDCILNGLYLTKGEQLADHHMVVEHAEPHCNSHEYFNGILADKSRGVFHGRILVRPVAQKTDAKQTNKNLLLSDEATANTKPQLEIYADDVKCTHGATIGQLNEESIFYLRARGIGLETAKRMLIHAFAGEIIERIRNEAVRTLLDQVIWARLEELEQVAVGNS